MRDSAISERIEGNGREGEIVRPIRSGVKKEEEQTTLTNKERQFLEDIARNPVSTQTGRLKVLVLTDKGKKAIPDVKIEKIFHKQASRPDPLTGIQSL